MLIHKQAPIADLPPNTHAQLIINGMATYTYERETTIHDIITRILDYCDQHNLYIDYYPSNAELGYDDTPVFAANWNGPGEYERNQDAKYGSHMCWDKTRLAKIGKWLEWRESNHADIQLQWSDEWHGCSDCNQAVRHQADSYSWTSSYVQLEYAILCRNCWSGEIENIISEYSSNYQNGFTSRALPPEFSTLLESAGFTCWQSESSECTRYETGYHHGQDDDPKKVYQEIMSDSHSWQVCFVITSNEQFTVDWAAYVRPIEED